MVRSIRLFLLLFPLASLAQQRPNVLFIIVDDLRPQLGCYGQSQMHTPHMDKLASQGALFRRAYCQQAVCNPSRSSLLTGRRPATTGISGNHDHFRCNIADVITLPQYFKQQGYHTQSIGKVYHTNLDDPASWSVKSWKPTAPRYGKPETLAWLQTENEKLAAAGKAYHEKIDSSADGTPMHITEIGKEAKGPSWEDPDVPDSALRDGSTIMQSLRVLRQLKNENKPFFLAIGISNPHLPFAAPKKYFDRYPLQNIRLAANGAPPADVPEYAMRNGGELYNYSDIAGERNLSPQKQKELVRGYYAATSYADALVGQLIAEFDALGLRKNTIIVLIGDHGWHLGESGIWGKSTNFEMGTRSPFIIAPPLYKHPGSQPQGLVELVDVYPTLADLAGLPLPSEVEGTSLKRYLQSPQGGWKSAAFSQFPRKIGGKKVMGHSIRTERWRYTEWLSDSTGAVEARELYNHRTDPQETKNLAKQPQWQSTVMQLSKQLRKGWKAALPKKK